jgi:hypothetical protein
MKNPFKPEHSSQDRDNPVVPNVVERPAERAAAGAGMHDNPLVPNAIERPVERGIADQGPIVNRRGINDGNMAADGRSGVVEHPTGAARDATTGTTFTDDTRHSDLFPNEDLAGYRTQWESIQTGFVDQPRAAVEEADALVSQVMNRLTEVFTRERSMLEAQWAKGDNVSTEDLRIALTRYRSFFQRLLSV